MDKITLTARYRQSLILYMQKHGVIKVAIKHIQINSYYRCIKRYGGTKSPWRIDYTGLTVTPISNV